MIQHGDLSRPAQLYVVEPRRWWRLRPKKRLVFAGFIDVYRRGYPGDEVTLVDALYRQYRGSL